MLKQKWQIPQWREDHTSDNVPDKGKQSQSAQNTRRNLRVARSKQVSTPHAKGQKAGGKRN